MPASADAHEDEERERSGGVFVQHGGLSAPSRSSAGASTAVSIVRPLGVARTGGAGDQVLRAARSGRRRRGRDDANEACLPGKPSLVANWPFREAGQGRGRHRDHRYSR